MKRIAGREVVGGTSCSWPKATGFRPMRWFFPAPIYRWTNPSYRGIGPGAESCRDGVLEMGHPGGDDLPFVYSGTLVVKGQGMARVMAIGLNTEMGKIGKSLQTMETEATPLQKETGRLVRNLAWWV